VTGIGLGTLSAGAGASSYYKSCGTFKYKGKHKLFKHKYECHKAKRKAKYVLKHHHAPPHWRCSLDEMNNGYAACQKHKHGWEFVPA